MVSYSIRIFYGCTVIRYFVLKLVDNKATFDLLTYLKENEPKG